MKSLVRASLSVLVVGVLFAFAGCGDDDSSTTPGGAGSATQAVGGAAAGAVECEAIGELCHEADTGSGTAHDCHETGHQGNAAACHKLFDGCVAACVVDENPGQGGGSAQAEDARCAALGELCHPVDDRNGPLHACHEVGHIGNAAKCAEAFDDCALRCLAARAELETPAPGAGGAGGSASGANNSGGMSSSAGAVSGGAGG